MARNARTAKVESETEEISDSIKENKKLIYTPISTDKLISTGSTLLDLAISGGRVRGGGLPGGIMVEISGPSASGKTSLLVEIGASVQSKGGTVYIADPEARLDKEYAAMHGMQIPADTYFRPDTVTELFDSIESWNPENKDVVNLFAADSIASLSSDLEMSDKGDARGQKKAKDLSEGCRKTARLIAAENKLVVLINQERDGDYGKVTSGGKAVGFHASVRIRVAQVEKIEQEKTNASGVKRAKTVGIISKATVFKSSVDDGYRDALLYIMYNFGIDDIRANLQYVKDMTKSTKYIAVNKEFVPMYAAINHIEENNLEAELRDHVIDLWEDMEARFKVSRKAKRRF